MEAPIVEEKTMTPSELALAIWKVTKPSNNRAAAKYLEALTHVLALEEASRYEKPFFVKKASGGTRRIVPAKPPLAFVQWILADWIRRTFPYKYDYCYTGQGVLAAARKHQEAKAAVVFDLKSAFDQIRADRIRVKLKTKVGGLSDQAMSALVGLLTYQGTTPQGCCSTPYVFNLVIEPVDRALGWINKELEHGGTKGRIFEITRYADNICISLTSADPVLIRLVQKRVRQILGGQGLQVSWEKLFPEPPFEFLGVQIFPNKLQLAEEKDDRIYKQVDEAALSLNPLGSYDHVVGLYTWTKKVCGDEFPRDLLSSFEKYFQRARRFPTGFADYAARLRTPPLFRF